MGNSKSNVVSDDNFAPPVVDFSGDAGTSPSVEGAEKMVKESVVKAVSKETQPKSDPKKLGDPKQACISEQGNKGMPPSKEESASPSPEKCNFSKLSVNKEGRNYILDVVAKPGTMTRGKIEVVSGYNKRKKTVTCAVDGLAGPCTASHKTKAIDFTDAYESKSDAQLVFKAASPDAFNFFPTNPDTNSYVLYAITCDAIAEAEVIVYPDTYWKLEVITDIKKDKIDNITVKGSFKEDDNSIDFAVSTKKPSVDFTYASDDAYAGASIKKDDVQVGYKDKEKGTGFVTYANKTSYGTHLKTKEGEYHNTYSADKMVVDLNNDKLTLDPADRDKQVKGDIQNKLTGYIEVLQKTVGIVMFIEEIVSTLTKALDSPITYGLVWPKLELKGEWSWKEIPGSPKCGFDVNLSGKFNPLIGFYCDFDIVGIGLRGIPVVGDLIGRLVKLYKKLSHNDFKINISTSSKLSFDISIVKAASAADFTTSVPPGLTKFEIKLAAEVKSQDASFIMSICGAPHGGGLDGSASINFYLHKFTQQPEGYIMPYDVEFTGISFVSYKFVKLRNEMSGIMPEEENYRMDKTDRKERLTNWLATKRTSHTILVI